MLIDADRVAREVVAPDGPAYAPMVERFGEGILDADGRIDRPAVAAVVFGDPAALADLNAITHPAIGATMLERKEAYAGGDDIVVLDIPLLRPEHRELLGLAAVVVVDVPPELALARLVRPRHVAGRRRGPHRRQVDRATRLAVADLVVDNSGDRVHLAGRGRRVWPALGPEGPAAPTTSQGRRRRLRGTGPGGTAGGSDVTPPRFHRSIPTSRSSPPSVLPVTSRSHRRPGRRGRRGDPLPDAPRASPARARPPPSPGRSRRCSGRRSSSSPTVAGRPAGRRV